MNSQAGREEMWRRGHRRIGVAALLSSRVTGNRTPRVFDSTVPTGGVELRAAGSGQVVAVGLSESRPTQGTLTQNGFIKWIRL